MKPQSKFFRPAHAQQVVGVSKSTIYRWVKEGTLKVYKHGSMSFIETKQAEEYIKALGD